MKIYDITRELISAPVYPGDPTPKIERLASMDDGDPYNLSALSLCLHNGTHVDAPRHFINDGKDVSAIDLASVVGPAAVIEREGDITPDVARDILNSAAAYPADSARRILIKGNATVTDSAATVFAKAGILLLGVESQSVGAPDAPMASHIALLSRGVILLEGLDLGAVPAGNYLLAAQPLKINGADGAPCRAILIELDW